MFSTSKQVRQYLKKLQAHLELENPILLEIVKSFRQLDRVAHCTGLLSRKETFARRVPWWPMISVLGTFSSGKSTFINGYLGVKLQSTGNQAVDDKFTVLCYGGDDEPRVLPGRALDADPRFPFYQMSRDLEAVAAGEGARVDSYLQLKTCHSEKLRGRILIDSPGFDADEQRNATLRITDHIIDLSDLVLVFFDARHPEPGAMHDTLEHLVTKTIRRPDATKFLYVLNQIDNAAREDNPEEVFAAWQRALAQRGLTAGRFYSVYSPEAAIAIADDRLRQRFETKRATDMAEIEQRIERVEVERAYRIIGVLEHTTKLIRGTLMPRLRAAKERWRRRTAWLDGAALVLLLAAFVVIGVEAGWWQGLRFAPPWWDAVVGDRTLLGVVLGGSALLLGYLHFALRRIAAQTVVAGLRRASDLGEAREWLIRAFEHNAKPWWPVWSTHPVGWGRWAERRLDRVLNDADRYIQTLNSRFADPSGSRGATPRQPTPAPTDASPPTPPPAPEDDGPPPPDYVVQRLPVGQTKH